MFFFATDLVGVLVVVVDSAFYLCAGNSAHMFTVLAKQISTKGGGLGWCVVWCVVFNGGFSVMFFSIIHPSCFFLSAAVHRVHFES